MSIRITSPIEGFSEQSTFGPVTLDSKDSVAEVEELSPALRAYFERKGYKLFVEDEGPFDPAAHKADDVLAYLEGLEGDQAVRPRRRRRARGQAPQGSARRVRQGGGRPCRRGRRAEPGW